MNDKNVLTRASNIPLVSSTYDMAAAAYASTKENHPYIKAVLDLAEKGVKQVSDVAAGSAQPLLSKLEPQIAAASHYASMGLDKLEEKLPILHQTADEVISDAQELVSSKVAEAKEVVAKTVQGGKEMVVETAFSGAEAVLDKSEQLLDYYLPMTDEELAEVAESAPEGAESTPEGADTAAAASEKLGYFVRLGSLSTKLRHRAYQYAVAKLKMARDNIKEAFCQLHGTIGQIEDTKQSDEKPQEEEEELHEVESQTLAMSSQITQQLQMAYKKLTAGIQGLPVAFQQNMQQACHHMEELHSYFTNAQSFKDISSSILRQAKERAVKAQQYVDDILEYVLQNTPLSWLVGPLLPAVKSPPAKPDVEEAVEEEGSEASVPDQ
ncbi:perilipin-3-like [Tiliqua scincoides]|uniref:perilipin-3-like n=1 Tax=Tiliqua scincoides TaxID=71010 RepID=UPI0034634D95